MQKRIILVTGGNRGLGQAIVEGLAKNKNDQILLGCRDLEEGDKVAEKVGENVKAVKMDLSSKEVLTENIEALQRDHASIDVLVNNAGVLHDGGVLEFAEGDLEQAFQVNTIAPVQLIRSFLPVEEPKEISEVVKPQHTT